MARERDIVSDMHKRVQDGLTGADWVSWYIELPSEQRQAALDHLMQAVEVFYKLSAAAMSAGAAFEELVKQVNKASD